MSQGFLSFKENTISTSSTTNPVSNYIILNTTGHSSFFESQERFNDAVSEFSGLTRSVHPEHFICQLDAYFLRIFQCQQNSFENSYEFSNLTSKVLYQLIHFPIRRDIEVENRSIISVINIYR